MTWVLDWIIAGMAGEGLLLAALWHWSRRGIPPGDLLPNLGAGACLLLAMRAGLAGGGWFAVATALLGALVLHGLDLRRRWRGTAP